VYGIPRERSEYSKGFGDMQAESLAKIRELAVI